MINKITGEIKINEHLIFSPTMTFEDFKETPFYDNQDGIRVIQLSDSQYINGDEYYVSFFFREGMIYALTLICANMTISEENEMERKKLHDKILTANNIESGKEYSWGKVTSEYDARSNSSEIVITYKLLSTAKCVLKE